MYVNVIIGTYYIKLNNSMKKLYCICNALAEWAWALDLDETDQIPILDWI